MILVLSTQIAFIKSQRIGKVLLLSSLSPSALGDASLRTDRFTVAYPSPLSEGVTFSSCLVFDHHDFLAFSSQQDRDQESEGKEDATMFMASEPRSRLDCGDALVLYKQLSLSVDATEEKEGEGENSLQNVQIFGVFGFEGNNREKIERGVTDVLPLVLPEGTPSFALEPPLSWQVSSSR